MIFVYFQFAKCVEVVQMFGLVVEKTHVFRKEG